MSAVRDVVRVGAGQELDLTGNKVFNGIQSVGRVIAYVQPLNLNSTVQARAKGNTTGQTRDHALGGVYNKTNSAFNVPTMSPFAGMYDKLFVGTGEVEVFMTL